MAVGAVGEQQAEFRIVPQLVQQAARRAVGGGIGSVEADPVDTVIIESDLLIPRDPLVFVVGTHFAAVGISIVVGPVLGLAELVQEIIIRESNGIEPLLDGGISSGGGKTGVGQSKHAFPGTGGGRIGVHKIGDHLPVDGTLSPVGSHVVFINALRYIIHSPVEPVDIEMAEPAVRRQITHRFMGTLHPDIPQVGGIIRPVTPRIPAHEAPGIGEAGPQHQLVELLHR